MYKPKCEKPLLLINKYNYTLLFHGAKLFILDKYVHIDKWLIEVYPFHKFLIDARNYSDVELDSCYVLVGDRKEPFFVYVPCGHCPLCGHQKQVDLINRSILETLSYDCPPYFFTLTYRDADLPRNGSVVSRELRYKDVQNFFKRLRRRWDRKKIKHNVFYLVAGEYGHVRHRPHYHVILWNNPYSCSELQPYLESQLREDVFISWGKCDARAFDFGQCRGGAAPYATKYVSKPCDMSGHYIKPFIHCSCRDGGLGSRFIDKNLDFLRSQPSQNYLEYLDIDGLYNYMYFSKYIQSRVWPSPSRLVPSSLRTTFNELCDVLSFGVQIGMYQYEDARNLADDIMPFPEIMRNRVVARQQMRLFGLNYIVNYHRIKRVVITLLDDLCVSTNVNAHYLQLYQQHRDSFVLRDNSDTAFLRQKILQQHATMIDKSVL